MKQSPAPAGVREKLSGNHTVHGRGSGERREERPGHRRSNAFRSKLQRGYTGAHSARISSLFAASAGKKGESTMEEKQKLKKNLGMSTAMATVVGCVIGSGVFFILILD